MEKIKELLNYLNECDSHKTTKKTIFSKSQVEKYSGYMMKISIGIITFLFIFALGYKVINFTDTLKPSYTLKIFTLCLIDIASISLILCMLLQTLPAIINIKNFKKMSQKLLLKNAEYNEEIIKKLTHYDKETLEDSKDHIQLKINSNTSKNHLFTGKNITVIFLLGLFYSYDSNSLDLLTIFSNIFSKNYTFWDFLTFIPFALILGFYFGAFGLSIENRRLTYYIDLVDLALKRKQRSS